MTQLDLFTGTASNAPVFRVPPATIWQDAAIYSPMKLANESYLYWVALWTGKPGWAVFELAWNGWNFCRVTHEIVPAVMPDGDTQILTIPHLADFPFFGEVPLSLLRVYWCEKSEFATEDEALKSLNSSDNHA